MSQQFNNFSTVPRQALGSEQDETLGLDLNLFGFEPTQEALAAHGLLGQPQFISQLVPQFGNQPVPQFDPPIPKASAVQQPVWNPSVGWYYPVPEFPPPPAGGSLSPAEPSSAFTTPHGTKRARPSPSSSSWCSSSSEQKIPRPRNAFIIFRQAHSQQVMRQLRDTNGQASTGQVSAVIGKLWRDASAETRKEFFDRANEEKRVHAIMYSGYKYQPKRKEVGKGRNASQGGGSKKRVTRASKRLGVEKEGAEEKVEETETEESEIGENQDRFSDSNCDDPTWRS